ncbi:hypothetical protein [Clostridium akagii]|uniref:hypothetical protein n=1 Tax=Clostridium akagii TaxID=91623 RepID=UPI00047A13F4|nr:hypothetical protein [Clostridium akagii]
MPQINRIRVNNVKYNNGTQIYDDFKMNFACSNTLYDLANGGGKSLLMLLLLQNLIPNCHLDEKQPIEKLFRGKDCSNVIHSLIEWRLDDGDKSGYKYMTTGFCARKGTENSGNNENGNDTAAFDYYNYCLFYNTYNENDINNLSLQDNKEKVTYNGLKKQLRELQSENSFVIVSDIFENKKGEYQRFISQHGLYESEWEIIRGINKTEGHVRGYFEENYRTSRKVVEDLLIEKIIQKAFMAKTNKENDDEDMAKTLLDIKDKILELSKQKGEISKFDRQGNVTSDFISMASSLVNVYEAKEKLEDSLVSTYNTLENNIDSKYSEKNSLEEDIESINKEAKEIEKNIATIKLQSQHNKLNITKEKLEDLQNSYEGADASFMALSKDIKFREAKNYFMDYIESKNKYDETNHLLKNIFTDNDTLTKDLNILAWNKKSRDDIKLKELNNQLRRALTKLEKISIEINESSNAERDIDKKIAVNESEISKSRGKQKALKDKVNAIRKQVNIMLISEIDSEIVGIEKHREQGKGKLELNKILSDSLIQQNNNFKIAIAKDEEKLSFMESKINQHDDLIKLYKADKTKAYKLLEVYSATDILDLSNSLDIKYKELLEIIFGEEKELKKLVDYNTELNQDKPMQETKEILKVKEYINRNYNEDGILGIEYLQGRTVEEKELLLSKIPFLPYSVIVTYNFKKLLNDEKFKECDFGNFAVPIISLESIKEKLDFNLDGLIFAVKDKSKFISIEKIKAEKAKIQLDIEERKNSLEILKRNETTLKKDNSYIKEFQFTYDNKIEDIIKEMAELKEQISFLKSERINSIKAMDGLDNQMKNLETANKNIIKEIDDLDGQLQLLSELKINLDNLNEEEKILQEAEENSKILKIQYSDIQNLMSAQKEEEKSQAEVKKVVDEKIALIKREWDDSFKTYYNEQVQEVLDITDEDLEAKFKGSKKALEEKNTDIKDKEELVKNYLGNMRKSEKETINRGYSIDKLYELKNNNEILVTGEEELKGLKDDLGTLKTKAENINKEIIKERSLNDNLQGNIDNLLSRFSDDFGQYIPIEMEVFLFKQFEEENILKGKKLVNKKGELLKLETVIYKEIQDLKSIIGDVEVTLRSNNILKDKTKAQLENKEDIKNYYEILENDYSKIRRKEKDSKTDFENGKEKNIKTLKEIGAMELAEEFARSIIIPTDTEKCLELAENLEKIKELLFLQKGKIENDIKDMEQIKDNFQNQCIQRCRDVKTELDRFPRLSKLNLNNELIQIVSLNLPYVNEQEQKLRMSEYIENTIKKVDSIQDSLEKMKYIKNQLALKRLFSVIVQDMNKIVLKLYKRERISQQSRTLEYEQAVGSTGQSQGIYIQFLISVINYIKNINSFNADNNKLRKTIFIDNPFGAAKDIYIWEPIFEFLKANNVQLIVPVRGATPAISGKFDVNYILGQKLIGDAQQTVVMEVRSQVSNQEVEFRKIEQEQMKIM